MHWSDKLVEIKACPSAVEWAATQPDSETAWAVCTRGDWLMWLLMFCLGDSPDQTALLKAWRTLLRCINDLDVVGQASQLRETFKVLTESPTGDKFLPVADQAMATAYAAGSLHAAAQLSRQLRSQTRVAYSVAALTAFINSKIARLKPEEREAADQSYLHCFANIIREEYPIPPTL